MNQETAKPFISWVGHGAVSLSPPARFSGVNAYAFLIEASRESMQGLVDTLLTPATGGQVVYTVLSPYCLVSFMAMEQCRSLADNVGWSPGQEAAWWIPLLETDLRTGRLRPVFWSPYIFIDYQIGLLTGREVWGWSKAMGRMEIELPQTAQPWSMRCQTTLFRTLSPNTRAETGVLFHVQSKGAPTPQDSLDTAQASELNTLIEKLFTDAALPQLKADWSLGTLSAIALKQFRDPANPQLCCYRAIVNSPLTITPPLGGIGVACPIDGTLTVRHFESHNIVEDFGLRSSTPGPDSTTVPLLAAFGLQCDFTVDDGSVIVQA